MESAGTGESSLGRDVRFPRQHKERAGREQADLPQIRLCLLAHAIKTARVSLTLRRNGGIYKGGKLARILCRDRVRRFGRRRLLQL